MQRFVYLLEAVNFGTLGNEFCETDRSGGKIDLAHRNAGYVLYLLASFIPSASPSISSASLVEHPRNPSSLSLKHALEGRSPICPHPCLHLNLSGK